MTKESFKRKLTAILSADVAGYSRLMGKDEETTVRILTEYRGVMTMLIQQHSGRVLDSKGDNLLAEFSSVVEAVLCAVAVQKEIKARNDKLPKDRRMDFRIGVNLGDVIDDGESIYGNGVNIAARLESLANPGGICISKTTFDHIDSKLPYGYEYMGDQFVKNIAKPVSAYRILMDPESAGRLYGEKTSKLKGWRWTVIPMIAVVAVGLVIWSIILRPAKDQKSEQNRLVPKGKEGSYSDASKRGQKKEKPEEKVLKTQLIFWESIKDSKDQKMFEEYLRKFPQGIFAGLAKINIKKISQRDDAKPNESGRRKGMMQSMPPPAPQKRQSKKSTGKVSSKKISEEKYEIIFWQSIEDSNNLDMFQEYLRRFPNGAFSGLAKIKIKTFTEVDSANFAALSKHKKAKGVEAPTIIQNGPKLGVDPIKISSKKTENLGEKNKKKKTALHLPQEKGDEEVVKTSQPPEELKPDNTIEIAVFPWRFNLWAHSAVYANPTLTETQSVDGLRQVLSEYKLVVPKFSYYDLGNQFNAKNIKDDPLTEAIVNDIWIKKSTFSKSKVNLDLICRLGRQLQVDAVLIYSIYIAPMKQNADIILIDIKTKKAYFKTEGIYVRTLSSDIKDLAENFFINYVNEKYKSHPNYETISWDFIKNSQNAKVFQQYLIKFPDGTFAGLAKLKITRLSKDKSKKYRDSDKKDSKTITKNKLKAAIFPWRFNLPHWFADPPPSISACLNGIFDIIQKYDEIELKYSYYENKKLKRAKVELIKSLIENNEKEFWVKKPSFSEFQPNFDVIYDYGKEISADLVLLTAIESISVMENIKVYLVDINNKKIYKAIDQRPDRPFETFLALSEKTIEDFLQETKKASKP